MRSLVENRANRKKNKNDEKHNSRTRNVNNKKTRETTRHRIGRAVLTLEVTKQISIQRYAIVKINPSDDIKLQIVFATFRASRGRFQRIRPHFNAVSIVVYLVHPDRSSWSRIIRLSPKAHTFRALRHKFCRPRQNVNANAVLSLNMCTHVVCTPLWKPLQI